MRDSRFHQSKGPFLVGELAGISDSKISRGNQDLMIRDLAALDAATSDTISFLENPKYLPQLPDCKAGAIILTAEAASSAPAGAVILVNSNPRKAYARIAQLFYPAGNDVPDGISPAAQVAASVTMGRGCAIDAGAVIGEEARLGNGVQIGANATIGRSVEIGDQTYIGANVTLSHCVIGARVRILPGVRIGQEGFGFVIDRLGHVRVPQLGRVIIGDDVEIGANSTVDRGAGPDTVIESGTMIDNLVQIGHNVRIGKGSVIVAQAGVSGSSRLGAFSEVGGQAGIAGHLTIGEGARIAGKSGIMRDVPAGASMMGYPAVSSRKFFKQIAWLAKNAGIEGEN